MKEKNEDPFGMATLVNSWLKSVGDHWGGMAEQWTASQDQYTTGSMDGFNPKAQAAMDAALKNFKMMGSAMATPESMTSLLKGSGAMPEILLNLTQNSLGSFFEMQQKMIERFGQVAGSAEAYQFDDIEENFFRKWTDTYDSEFKKFFQIPQLGLMRTYQEKANELANQYNVLQSTLAEFLSLLSLPLNKTVQVMQEKIGEMAEAGELPDDSKVYYNMWVKVLEGHYMTLYQTPEYAETLARTINSLADFSAARDAALEDLLGTLPVARKTEMDDMARELYELKKRVRKLEKERK